MRHGCQEWGHGDHRDLRPDTVFHLCVQILKRFRHFWVIRFVESLKVLDELRKEAQRSRQTTPKEDSTQFELLTSDTVLIDFLPGTFQYHLSSLGLVSSSAEMSDCPQANIASLSFPLPGVNASSMITVFDRGFSTVHLLSANVVRSVSRFFSKVIVAIFDESICGVVGREPSLLECVNRCIAVSMPNPKIKSLPWDIELPFLQFV